MAIQRMSLGVAAIAAAAGFAGGLLLGPKTSGRAAELEALLGDSRDRLVQRGETTLRAGSLIDDGVRHQVVATFACKKGDRVEWEAEMPEAAVGGMPDKIQFYVKTESRVVTGNQYVSTQQRKYSGALDADSDGKYLLVWYSLNSADPIKFRYSARLVPKARTP
jgi:hypothetical protein